MQFALCTTPLYSTQPHASRTVLVCIFFFTDTAPTEIYTLSLHDALPISPSARREAAACAQSSGRCRRAQWGVVDAVRSEEHTSELQSQSNLVCRLLLEKKKIWHQEQAYASNGAGPSAKASDK